MRLPTHPWLDTGLSYFTRAVWYACRIIDTERRVRVFNGVVVFAATIGPKWYHLNWTDSFDSIMRVWTSAYGSNVSGFWKDGKLIYESYARSCYFAPKHTSFVANLNKFTIIGNTSLLAWKYRRYIHLPRNSNNVRYTEIFASCALHRKRISI